MRQEKMSRAMADKASFFVTGKHANRLRTDRLFNPEEWDIDDPGILHCSPVGAEQIYVYGSDPARGLPLPPSESVINRRLEGIERLNGRLNVSGSHFWRCMNSRLIVAVTATHYVADHWILPGVVEGDAEWKEHDRRASDPQALAFGVRFNVTLDPYMPRATTDPKGLRSALVAGTILDGTKLVTPHGLLGLAEFFGALGKTGEKK